MLNVCWVLGESIVALLYSFAFVDADGLHNCVHGCCARSWGLAGAHGLVFCFCEGWQTLQGVRFIVINKLIVIRC